MRGPNSRRKCRLGSRSRGQPQKVRTTGSSVFPAARTIDSRRRFTSSGRDDPKSVLASPDHAANLSALIVGCMEANFVCLFFDHKFNDFFNRRCFGQVDRPIQYFPDIIREFCQCSKHFKATHQTSILRNIPIMILQSAPNSIATLKSA